MNIMVKSIKKRDGRIVLYDESKIASAVLKAMEAAGEGDATDAAQVANDVHMELEKLPEDMPPQIEQVQDAVERELMKNGFEQSAKKFILYRAKRTNIREANTSLMRTIDEITNVDARLSDMKRDNANIDGNTSMGSMLQIGAAGAKSYNAAYLLTEEQAKAYLNGDIHIHDFDFYSLTTTCTQIDIVRLFKGGFSTGHGVIREPQSIQSYAALAAIAIQSNQNDQHGGQSIPNFDYGLAKGVAKTFAKLYTVKLTESLEDALESDNESEIVKEILQQATEEFGHRPCLEKDEEAFDAFIAEELIGRCGLDTHKAKQVVATTRRRAVRQTENETYQAMEGFVHNLNTMHSRAGAQTPFSSINYGTDTSPEGRMVIRNVLLATDAGLGNGEDRKSVV